MNDRYYGFDLFDRGAIDGEIETLFCADTACTQGTSSPTYGVTERGVSATCINNVASVSKVDACEANISTLSCNVDALARGVEDTSKAIKTITERLNRLEGDWGGRLKRSDLRTLRVG